LELDLEHYVIPSPTAPRVEYAANLAANPASLTQTGTIMANDMLLSDGVQSPRRVSANFEDHNPLKKVCDDKKI
jgi:6-phosphofructo-2-kinase / fructose-2,6-biphosphatase 3